MQRWVDFDSTNARTRSSGTIYNNVLGLEKTIEHKNLTGKVEE